MDHGFSKLSHYASAKLGGDGRRARELARIGELLEGLPLVDAALAEGVLTWSKGLHLCRVVSAAPGG